MARTRRRSGNTTIDLFDLQRTNAARPVGWVPALPPELHGETTIRLDFETTGLRWWEKDVPVGAAYWLPKSGRHGYVAWGHEGGGNGLTPDQARDWLRSLRGLHLDNSNTKFDLHMSRAFGADLTEQDCTFGDVAHRAALLDDHRFRFGLDQLAKDFLDLDTGKEDLGLSSKGNLWRLPAWAVEKYAVRDVELVDLLCAHMDPLLQAQGLGTVHGIEQEIIPVVVEMEKNGCYLDVERLFRWKDEATAELEEQLWKVHQATGVMVSSPDSPKDLQRVFEALSIPLTLTANGRPSFTGEILGALAKTHEPIAALLYAAQLADLKSKYLDKYAATVRQSDGWIRYNMHQLRIGRDEQDKYGTVSGRFSSAGDEEGGFNVQQVVSPKKQKTKNWCTKYIIRNLFLPGSPDDRRANPDLQWLAVDADQIEYRIFAHFANSPDIMAAYAPVPGMSEEEMQAQKRGPYTDYHDTVQLMLKQVKPDIERKHTKITNFCKLFGAGIPKFGLTLELITQEQFDMLNDKYAPARWKKKHGRMDAMRSEPCLQSTLSVYDAYDTRFPDAKRTLDLAKETAANRGWVQTYDGRRARFPGKQRTHSALNRAVQGTAADINKRAMIEIYKLRRELELVIRQTVHDENDYDLYNPSKYGRIMEIFNTQRVPLRVKILWTGEMGPSWGEAKGKA